MSTPNTVRGVTFGEGDGDAKAPGALGGVNNTQPGLTASEGVAETFVRQAGTFPWFDSTVPDPVSTAQTGSINKAARRDHRHNMADDSSIQKVEVFLNGTFVAARKRLNFKEAGGITIDVEDNASGNAVDITISA